MGVKNTDFYPIAAPEPDAGAKPDTGGMFFLCAFGRLCFFCAHLFAVALFFSCSLDYGQSVSREPAFPELTVYDADYLQIRDGKKNVRLSAGQLELYKNDPAFYGTNLDFTLFNDELEISAYGKAAFITADRLSELYSLLGGTEIVSVDNNLKVSTTQLKWNNKTEQLTSGKNDPVSIIRGGFSGEQDKQVFTVSGSGFSASGLNMEYLFLHTISGSITDTEETGGGEK